MLGTEGLVGRIDQHPERLRHPTRSTRTSSGTGAGSSVTAIRSATLTCGAALVSVR